MNKRRCPHDGGACHHYCELGECFRSKTCEPLSEPHDGFPEGGKYEAKIESIRVVSVEWSGRIFDTPQQAKKWAIEMRNMWIGQGVDPASIRFETSRGPDDPKGGGL